MRKHKKLIIVLVVGLMLIVLPLVFRIFPEGVSAVNAEDQINQPDKFPVTNPVVMDTAYTVDYIADIQALQYVELRAKVGGYLNAIHIDEGQKVKKGDLLFSISRQGYESELLRAQASLKSAIAEAKVAEVELENVRALVENDVVSETELRLAQSKLEVLQAKIEEARSNESSARLNLQFTQLYAPFDGIIGRIPNKVGSLVEEGTSLTSISDHSQVYAYFNVSEREYLNLIHSMDQDKGQNVSLVMLNNQLYPYPGKIGSIDSRIDKETGNIAFRALFANPDHLLRHGATGKVRLRKEVKQALIIPQKSAFTVQDRMYVFALNDENVVERRIVVPRLSLPHVYVLESGLSTTDRVIYEGIQHVREGEEVAFKLVDLQGITVSSEQVAQLY